MATKDDPQFRIRLPVALKKQIEEAAKSAGRSLNSEIEKRLERTFMDMACEHYYSDRPREDYIREIEEEKKNVEQWKELLEGLSKDCDPIERAILRYELYKEKRHLEQSMIELKKYDEEQEFLKSFRR